MTSEISRIGQTVAEYHGDAVQVESLVNETFAIHQAGRRVEEAAIQRISAIAQIIVDYLGASKEAHTLIANSLADHVDDVSAGDLAERIIERDWYNLPSEQRSRLTCAAWQIAGRPGQLQGFSLQQHLASCNRSANQFCRDLMDRSNALSRIPVTSLFQGEFLRYINQLAAQNIRFDDRYEKRSQLRLAERQQRLLWDASFVMRGGRASFDEVGGADFNSRFSVSRPSSNIDKNIDLDVASWEAVDRLRKNHGCLLPDDRDRRAIRDFLSKIVTKNKEGEIVPGKINEAFKKLQETSPAATDLLVQIFDNYHRYRLFFGNVQTNLNAPAEKAIERADYRYSQQQMLAALAVVHCAYCIDQFENDGRLIKAPKTIQAFFRCPFVVSQSIRKEELQSVFIFVESYTSAIRNHFSYQDMKKSFAVLMQQAPDIAKDLAVHIGTLFHDIMGNPVMEGGKFLIEETGNQEIIDKIFAFLDPLLKERAALVESLSDQKSK